MLRHPLLLVQITFNVFFDLQFCLQLAMSHSHFWITGEIQVGSPLMLSVLNMAQILGAIVGHITLRIGSDSVKRRLQTEVKMQTHCKITTADQG